MAGHFRRKKFQGMLGRVAELIFATPTEMVLWV